MENKMIIPANIIYIDDYKLLIEFDNREIKKATTLF